ncbi:MAG TPA: alpha/beta hydrolase-fold protein [Vicinamibacterales bacterium]|nr:alpha/beta hydrolase-fold protein [Vicinamibacterales bacterium]
MFAKSLIIRLTLVALGAIAVDAHAQAKAIRMPTAAGSERIFSILLPQSYETSKARYPVVYLFHGGGQDHTAFMARTAFPPMARKHEFIVVMPAADRNYSVLGPEAQGRYNDYVAGELVDYVDSHYRTIATKESRAIAGLSMGGRIASMTGLTHPDRFGTVGAFSPAIRPDAEDAVRNVAAAAPFFYISCGTLDSLLPINREFVGWLMERDLPHDYKEAPGLGHTWALWDEQIGVFFDLLQSRGFKSAS